MTIIHIAGGLGGGGAEQMVLQLACKSTNNFDTRVYALSNSNELESKYKEHQIYYKYLNINSFKNKSLWRGLVVLHNDIKDKTDIIFHCHQFHSYLLIFLYKIKYKSFPVIFTLHSSVVEELSRKIILFLTKPFRNMDIIFSENTKSWFLKNSVVIPNGINFEDFNTQSIKKFDETDVFNFLFAGRLSPEKNPLSLIGFASNLLNLGKNNFVINVLGIGALYNDLEFLIKKNNLEKYIILKGFSKNINQHLIEAHCLLLPSLYEGLPVILLEAAASKLPIITTPVGSIPEFFNNTNGYICDINLFPEAMVEIMSNYKMACEKSLKLYNELKFYFNIDKVYQQHLDCYKSLIKLA